MSQPPQGEESQDPRPPAPGWGPPPEQRQPPGQSGQDGGWGPPSAPHGGWGPPSGAPAQGSGWGQQPGQYGGQQGGYGNPYGPPESPGQQGQCGPPGGYGPPSRYGAPGQYGAPGGYGRPGRYGAPGGYGQPGQSGGPSSYGAPTGYGQPGQYGAPYGQYGQPGPWGQPPQPARRKSRAPRVLGLVLLAVLVIGAALTLPFLLGSTRLDPQAVQRDVAAQFEQREGVPIDLRCGQEMTVEDGRAYRCDGTTADGQQVPITITINGTDGNYTWSDR